MQRPLPSPGRFALVVATALSVSACTGGPRMPGPVPEAQIVVDNTRAAVAGQTVYLVNPRGENIRLGQLALNEKKAFTVRERGLMDSYRLFLGSPSRPLRASRWFDLKGGDRIEWDLARNRVLFMGNVQNR